MAEGGGSWSDEEDGDDIDELMFLPFLAPYLAECKREGDARFRAKDYQEAATFYFMALTCPIPRHFDVSVISEQLFRRRAECLFKLGKYFEAIDDCERAIEIADCTNSRNLVKSLFIKMKAIQCLGDYVPALPLAVWCKHLRPQCEKIKAALKELKDKLRNKFSKDDTLINEVLFNTIGFAKKMEEERETLKLALECYTELLDLLDFMFLSGVLLRRAGCLFHLGRLNEAKEDCEKALWRLPDEPEALALMHQITQALKATRETNTKEKEKRKQLSDKTAQVKTVHLTSEDKKEPPTLFEEKQIGDVKPNVDLAKAQTTESENLTASPTLFEVRSQATVSAEEKEEIKLKDDRESVSGNEVPSQATFLKEDNEEINPNGDIELIPDDEKKDVQQDISASASAAEKVTNEGKETKQPQEVAGKDDEKKEMKKKRNKQKKKKKKEKKKKKKETPARNDNGSEQKPTANAPSPDVSDDESESQETESIIGETDVSLGYSDSTNAERNKSSATLSSTFKASKFSDDEDSVFDDFIKVQNPRRSYGQTARPTAMKQAPDKDKLPSIAVKTPHQQTAVASQSSSRQNTPLQQMHSFDTPEIPGNGRSSFFERKKFPAAEKGSSEMSAEGSVNTCSTAHAHSKQPELSNVVGVRSLAPSTSQGFQREGSIRQPITEQYKANCQDSVFQKMQVQVSNHDPSSLRSSSTGSGISEISYTPVNPSQTFQRNVTARKLEFNDPRKIPDGVIVLCNHFLQQYCTQTASTAIKSKACTACVNRGFLRYAVWNNVKHYWQVIRPYPTSKVPPKVTLVVCRHFSTNTPCPKEPCTFPHGKVEAIMWTMERQGFLPSPQESFSAAQSGLSSITPFQTQCTRPGGSGMETSPTISMSSFDDFPSLGAVSSPNLTSNITRNAVYSAWNTPIGTPRASLPPVLSPRTPVMDFKSSNAEGALSTQRFTAGADCNATTSAFSTSPVVPPIAQSNGTGFKSAEISPPNSLKNAAPSAWTTHFNSSGRFTTPPLLNAPSRGFSQIRRSSSLSSLQTTSAQSLISVSDSRKIPPTVFVVCDDFLQKNLKRPASINEKIKACKGCENRSRLSYAIWSSTNKEWQKIRPYPTKVPVQVAFKVCKQYDINKQCLRTPCSFAHGEEELLMWTLEREGVLPNPKETLTGKAVAQISPSTQSSTRLQYRPCPPGVTNGAYKLCRSCYTHERCRFGRGCIFAHSLEELNEWEEEYLRKERDKRVKEIQDRNEILSMEMVSEILKEPAENLVECLPGVDITCNPPELSIKLQDKNGAHACQWTFSLVFKINEVGSLRHVLLLHRYHNCYQLSEISVGSYQENPGCETYKLGYSAKLKDVWYRTPEVSLSGRVKVSVTVSFSSSLYGSFDQCVVFDFGKKPYLVQKLNADVHSDSLSQCPTVSEHDAAPVIWEEGSVEVVRFVYATGEALQGEHLSRTYSLRKEVNIAAETLSRDNYKQIMHQLLFVEEGFMKDEISRYTLSKTQLHAQRNIFDEMTGMQCALDNELFGVLSLQEEDALRPDDAAGRLLYRNVSSVWLQLAESASNKVYEAHVEKVESECVVLRLSSKMCSDLNLYDTCDIAANAQFQLNRWPLCEMHAAVDRLTTGQLKRLVFPDPTVAVAARNEVKIRWQWLLDHRLNDNQKTVIKRIASPEYNAPPLVVFGPFGTGKTFTLNQAVRLLVQVDKSHRVLLCTHSNRAADIHVEFLHKYLTEQNGIPASRPLRVYQPMRRLETASEIARKYCLIKNGVFMLPSRDDLVEHRVVITTLSTSKVLLDLQVFHGFFTHILIDEAAQALEPEALTPLVFAGPNTKVVFTGDHMQMSPEVYSPNARQQGLQKSLPERLFDLYDRDKPEGLIQSANVMFLTENYRCNKEILQFPSDNFYGEKLIARGHASQAPHPKYGPLLFFSARGKEQKEHDNSYINLPEVSEVVKRMKEVANSWPTSVWGPKKLSEIAVLSSYRYQVQAIRNSLRKDRDLKEVKVDTIHNVQGEEFRVLFISTVRTFHTCKPQQEQVRASGADRQLYWEFLSDPKLLNTAVTRARCLVAVVGDPVSLCTVGECRSIWKDYIKRCDKKRGLYGTTMGELEKQINAAIASIQLNPEAKSFVPKDGSEHEPTVTTHQSCEHGVFLNESGAEETRDQETNEEKSDEVRSNVPQEAVKNAIEKDEQDLLNASFASDVAHDKEQQEKLTETKDDEEEPEDYEGNEETEDFQDDLLEDETVSPRYMDEIILAFVKKCEETSQLDADRRSMFEDAEFPPLEASGSRAMQVRSAKREGHSFFNEPGGIKDLFPEIRVVNGRVEVRLTNLGLYKAPSERAQRIIASTKQQEFLDPSVLRQLLQDEPQKYLLCNLRLSPEKSQVGYAQIEDTETPDIQIKGKVRQAFDKDKVVIELVEKKVRSKGDGSEPQFQGKVVGVLEHIISPHERQFVCTPDYENPSLMIPINKSATKLVNLTDKSCKDIPVYKKDQNGRATKVKMMKRETVLSGKYLFLVKYLQWRRDFSNPLGIVVRTMDRGEDLKSSMEIAYAEHGIRRAFRQETLKYVKEKFPPEWCIPQNEYSDRTRVSKAFTIDPPTSLDLDDALTIEETSSSTFLIGIHIADVSFFVKPNSPLDQEAFLRCTSYYHGEDHENLPMLPRELSEGHCSLFPDKDRLAVSVFVTLNNEGRITEGPNVRRTIVRSSSRLTYDTAQVIIKEGDVSTTEIPVEIMKNIRQLSFLAQNRRRHRLGDGAFDHWQNEGIGDSTEAHELVEEMMIMANEEVAKLLSAKCPEMAPLRVQLPPKDHKLSEWTAMHGKYARLSLQLARIFQKSSDTPSALGLLHSEKTKFKIQRWVWGAICQAANSRDISRVSRLICSERNHPQIAAAQSQFRRIQSESRFVCEGDQPPENIQHYSLGMRTYTQFTSPIRRYMDIAVHRLLLGLQSGSRHEENMSKDEMAKICRRSTFLQANARKFEKDCKRIQTATKLQQRCHESRVFIESIDHHSISLHICKPEDDHLAGRQKRLLLSHLNPVALKEEEEDEDEQNSVVLKWRFRKYTAPDAHTDLGGDHNATKASYGGIGEVLEIPSDIWLRILDAIRSSDEDKLTTIIKETEAQLNKGKELPQPKLHDHARGEHYRHPHHNDKVPSSSSATVDHFYEKSHRLKRYDFFSVQLCPHMVRGILEPDIQLFKVNAHLNICIEHRRYPRESFAHTARHQASRERYGNINEYITAWKPVLAMEAATEAVKENDGFIIEQLNVMWEEEDGNVSGLVSLPSSYCSSRQLNFYPGDLVCVRVPYPNMDSQSSIEKSHPEKISQDYAGADRLISDVWVGHCIIKDVILPKKMKKKAEDVILPKDMKKDRVEIKMYLHQASSSVPEELKGYSSHKSTLELIHRTLPQRRMYDALCKRLKGSSDLVHAICKGEEPTNGNFGFDFPTNLSLVQHRFQQLNQYQEAAVREALTKPFTLIQGPPGTGKTVTGVHIAYWFAEGNKRLESYKVREEDSGETEVEGAPQVIKAPPQVIYCGPSNKSVDVVTEYLMRIPSLNILRVYSDQVEQKEFPIPNKLKPARITRSDDELKICNEKLRSVSLHHVIRSAACPYEQELRQYEEGFAEDKRRKEEISQKDVDDYCKLIGRAENWALKESGAQIILCTCATSGSPRITTSCDNIQQCIVDECGMCMEPESLVPITCSGARQIVLIGDHKQLQPVIQDHVAKALGLSVSMFERHSKRARMLRLQYRMHHGICEFPSTQFYDGKLETAEVVKSRSPSPVTFWPAMVRRKENLPIVFCHVEGQEESSAIATSESNEDSKRNMKEVRKVVQVAKYLVNHHRPQVRMSNVVILSPYREQRSKISELLKGAYDEIQVTTVTKSQGSEWDYVIISLVRSLKKDEIDPEPTQSWLREHLGFLTDEHQMNVGLTRARRGLCIIGNKYLLGMDEMWGKLLQHYEENHCLVDESWPWQ